MNIKLIRAFIASPSDLEEERLAARKAAEEVNRSVARPLNARLELIGWEEFLSGAGRPQSQINVEMQTCDLFVGAIWTSWGSRPSTDGPYTSGFEEEFELSRARLTSTGSPKMAMYFKEVPPAKLHNPDAELSNVLGFQERLREEKAFLYGTFTDAADFASQVRQFLCVHVIRILTAADGNAEDRPAHSRPESTITQPAEETEDSRENVADAASEDAQFVERISQVLRTTEGASEVEVARLRLIAAVSGHSTNDRVTLGVHDANLLYNHRAQFTLSDAERRGLASAGVANLVNENVPLWSWFGEMDRRRSDLLFIYTVLGDDSERAGAITALRLLGRPLSALKKLNPALLVSSWFDESRGSPVKIAALRYLKVLGNVAQLAAVKDEVARADKDTVGIALETAISILLRDSKAEAARFVLLSSFETLPSDILKNVFPYFAELGSEELAAGLDHRAPDVRARTVELLAERGVISTDTIRRAQDDNAAVVRAAAVEALDRMAKPLSLDEAHSVITRSQSRGLGLQLIIPPDPAGRVPFERYQAARIASMSTEELKGLLSTDRHRDAAYRALARRKEGLFATALRTHLADGFKDYFDQHWPNGITNPPTNGLLAFALGNIDPAEAKRRDLSEAALDVVADQRDVTDLPIVRFALDNLGISPRPKVIAFLRSLGDAQDVERLSRTPQYYWSPDVPGDIGGIFREAIAALRHLSGASLSSLLKRDLPETVRTQLIQQASWEDIADLSDAEIVSILLTENDGLRRMTARKVSASLPRRRVAKVLAAYKADERGIYYLVIHWLDLGLGFPQHVARTVINNGNYAESTFD
ncbi:MAG: DUF4062 domain-containing protein [Burkholderiales bacterium]